MVGHDLETSSQRSDRVSQRASPAPIRILLVEDVVSEAEIVIHHLRKGGIPCHWSRVETEDELREALRSFEPTLVLSDFTLPQFDGLSALQTTRELAADVPFIFVSGTIGEERAIEALKSGAVDYVLKTNLSRLVPAIRRALDDAVARAEHRRQERQIAHLTRVLRMLSGVNALVARIRDRADLMQEACRLAVTVGGYATAFVMIKHAGASAIEPVAWTGIEPDLTERFRAITAESASRAGSIVGRVLESGSAFVCNDSTNPEATTNTNDIMVRLGLRSLVALPLIIERTPIGVLLLAALDAGTVTDEELGMLREVAANLSFALQYLQANSTVQFLSHFDPHTGLAKRSLFCERLDRLLARESDHTAQRAVAVIDIQQLSVINDSFGRHIGDLLLQHVSDRLRRHFHGTELFAHFGGGRFAVVVDMPGRGEALAHVLNEHVAAVFGQPFEVNGHQLPVAVRSGAARHPDNGLDSASLIQNAEAALRIAKSTGEQMLPFSSAKQSEVVASLALEHQLRGALERKEFDLHYQAKVSVRTCRIEGAEALLRWWRPGTGLVSPATFLPLLETSGLIVDVGTWVLDQAVRDSLHWKKLGLPAVRTAVNISPQQLRLPEFAPQLLTRIKPRENDRCDLDIEITEGALLDHPSAEIRTLKLLRAAGIRIAIDDFGTGYSSLSRLAELPIDTLKIDRAFIRGLPTDRSGGTVVSTIIALARAFNMTVVAEGVETPEQLHLLRKLGCDQAQGYLHSKPIPREEFASLLEHGRATWALPALDRANARPGKRR